MRLLNQRFPRFLKLGLFCLVAFASGCSTTPYQPKAENGGYSSRKLSENSYEVFFEGVVASKQQQHHDYALLYAAELTQAEGMKYFIVMERGGEKITKNIRYAAVPTRREKVSETNERGRIITRTVVIEGIPARDIPETRQVYKLKIQMVSALDAASGSSDKVFEAKPTIDKLRAKYRL